jgi:type VI secretion system secreted protein VgrG
MLSTFQNQFMPFIWRPENDGQGFHETPGDPGGATAWGVTLSTFEGWRLINNHPRPSVLDLKNATKTELTQLYRILFWHGVNADMLPPGVDLVVANFGCAVGPKRAAEHLQACLGFAETECDGVVGPVTLTAARKYRPADLVARCTVNDEAYYKGLGMPRFLNGWDRRALDCQKIALVMASQNPPAEGVAWEPLPARTAPVETPTVEEAA